MAYNPYAGTGFNVMQPTGQPLTNFPYTYNPVQQPAQQTNIVSMALVNSEDEARNYPLSPGGSMFLMDSNNCLFYTKSVDFSGISTFKKYEFHEVTDAPAAEAANPNYITREEFEELKSQLNRNNKPYRKERNNESAS